MILCFIFREKLLHLGVEENDSGPVNSQVIIVFISIFSTIAVDISCCNHSLILVFFPEYNGMYNGCVTTNLFVLICIFLKEWLKFLNQEKCS